MASGKDGLFHHNPPGSRELRRELFVGRERELRRLAERIPGSVSSSIRAIHGNLHLSGSLACGDLIIAWTIPGSTTFGG